MQKYIVFNRHSDRDSELRYSNKKRIFSQYGSIQKIIINKNGYLKNESDYPTYSSYITYSSQIEASLALLALNNSNHLNHKLNACFGTNKYCNSFLKGVE